ncbi:hypothetical protein [Clostridium luticellarii]|jgi:ribosomal protein S15P/S13E|uniref:Uncharacterized protein n=1 Tax=Clostridium luticellarii TaxID=1691940 RepID=A0A2T0BK19_9CLOT|nr:hypothetical protein [Clostridium luticellarii]MCI1944942.1 hypothetical protein [Clostridium luticellarii]MCI1968382.1 hypothetical protein [Clostridium luticellarii]MCI1995380.1 hypothetical protein [Clostridium luticellarii]MCI2039443.1 hypothetical protein [Clostridium luticellarii]PRR84246.1 hypothetical protein CLLU_24530 [Clostridium luticellarii]
MSHKGSYHKKSVDVKNNDLGYYENRAESLKKTVKQLEKMHKKKKEVMKLEKKRRHILRQMRRAHK